MDQEKSFSRLKAIQPKLEHRIKQVKEGVIARQNLQVWWRQQYDSLHSSVRELLLLEDVKLRAPITESDHEEWAKANINKYRSRAVGFVADLYVQQEKENPDDPLDNKYITYDPLDDLPNYVANVILRSGTS